MSDKVFINYINQKKNMAMKFPNDPKFGHYTEENRYIMWEQHDL